MSRTPKPSHPIARPNRDQPVSWLGGLSPDQFMRRYWQKKPLLVRGAFPDFTPPVSIQEVLELACDDRAESRLIRRTGKGQRWALTHGPFEAKDIPPLRKSHWTVLVQQVNTRLPAADRFLDAFRFVPQARLDDLMISVAGPSGGIGAHVDSYDVFLIQASGQRRWEIAKTFDPTLEEDVPLKILKEFVPEEDWVLAPGDLLYLPPNVAHRGTAVGDGCMTWSIGFRAPARNALADAVWTGHLDTLVDQNWKDPWLEASNSPAEIPGRLLDQLTEQVLNDFPSRKTISRGVARVLSEPAQEAVFESPRRPDNAEKFKKNACRHGLRLACSTRILYQGSSFFANGEAVGLPRDSSIQRLMKTFANERAVSGDALRCCKGLTVLMPTLYEMYLAGWISYD